MRQPHLREIAQAGPPRAGLPEVNRKVSGRSGRVRLSPEPDRPACAWPFGIGLPRQGTEVVAPMFQKRDQSKTCSRLGIAGRRFGAACGRFRALSIGSAGRRPVFWSRCGPAQVPKDREAASANLDLALAD